MEYKPTTKIVLPRGNGKSTRDLKNLIGYLYATVNKETGKIYIRRDNSLIIKNSK